MKGTKHRIHIKANTGLIYTLFVLAATAFIPLILSMSSDKITALTGLSFPQGAKYYYNSLYRNDNTVYEEVSESQPKPTTFADDLPEIKKPEVSEQPLDIESRMGKAPDIPDEQKQDILKMQIKGSGTNFGCIWVKNETGNSIDIEKILNAESPLKISNPSKPTVLIYHTHTTEAYLTYDTGWFDTKNVDRSSDLSLGVAAVGDVVARKLQSAGIGVIHDTKVYDSPAYNGAYKRSAETIQYYLDKYPSIKIVLDIHRDSMVRDSGVRIKPVAEVDGKNAAQIMIISGCENETSLEMPNWRDNLNLAIKLQNALEMRAPGITRPISFKIAQYNQQYSSGGLLLEVGTDVNTIDEALHSASLLGDSLCTVIKEIHGEEK